MVAPTSYSTTDSMNAPFVLQSHVASIEHPEKIDRGGEDAFFALPNALGVFDGLGGSMKYGIDSGIYARELALLVSHHVKENGPFDLSATLGAAADLAFSEGSCTAALVGLHGEYLNCFNVGDSGIAIFRKRYVLFKSAPQQTKFNHPVCVSSKCREGLLKGVSSNVLVGQGDIVILASDGLWDNVSMGRISRIIFVTRFLSGLWRTTHSKHISKFTIRAAWGLAKCAENISKSRFTNSPFSQQARSIGLQHDGGKEDDIMVIVGVVMEKTLHIL